MKSNRPKRRRAAALVETALVLSILIVLAFGLFEYGLQFHVINCMTNAARDAARVLAVQGGTAQQAQTTALNELSGINAAFTVTATTSAPDSSGNQDVTVQISVPKSSVSLGIVSSASGQLVEKATMRKEGN